MTALRLRAVSDLPRRGPGYGWEDLTQLVVPERVIRLVSTTKAGALEELVACAERTSGLSPHETEELRASVAEREEAVNTQLAPGWAVPHGRIEGLGEPLLVIGRSTRGIPHGPSELGPVVSF